MSILIDWRRGDKERQKGASVVLCPWGGLPRPPIYDAGSDFFEKKMAAIGIDIDGGKFHDAGAAEAGTKTSRETIEKPHR
jgi:hypothetical protein